MLTPNAHKTNAARLTSSWRGTKRVSELRPLHPKPSFRDPTAGRRFPPLERQRQSAGGDWDLQILSSAALHRALCPALHGTMGGGSEMLGNPARSLERRRNDPTQGIKWVQHGCNKLEHLITSFPSSLMGASWCIYSCGASSNTCFLCPGCGACPVFVKARHFFAPTVTWIGLLEDFTFFHGALSARKSTPRWRVWWPASPRLNIEYGMAGKVRVSGDAWTKCNKKLLGAPGIATRCKDATNVAPGITTKNKELRT